MSEPPSDPIPSELSQAFYEAALLCHDGSWSPAHPEYPTVREAMICPTKLLVSWFVPSGATCTPIS